MTTNQSFRILCFLFKTFLSLPPPHTQVRVHTYMYWRWVLTCYDIRIVIGKVEELFLSFHREISVPWNLNMIIWFGIRYFYWLAITLFPVAFIFPWMSSELCKLLAAILNTLQQTMHVAVLVLEWQALLGLWDIPAASSKIITQKRKLLTAASFWETFPGL